ncbi:hypothetical protein B7C42_07656 [Nocardia cerradoensis]|uniref:Uncharacterized protein n=1 Tax=Nocardia cerradoensis TaxID=85688 RepID=A0A231GUS2_9NOCA|nr:hypothetical protein B7C42_07656 [Nocardia cerradoensis]
MTWDSLGGNGIGGGCLETKVSRRPSDALGSASASNTVLHS